MFYVSSQLSHPNFKARALNRRESSKLIALRQETYVADQVKPRSAKGALPSRRHAREKVHA